MFTHFNLQDSSEELWTAGLDGTIPDANPCAAT